MKRAQYAASALAASALTLCACAGAPTTTAPPPAQSSSTDVLRAQEEKVAAELADAKAKLEELQASHDAIAAGRRVDTTAAPLPTPACGEAGETLRVDHPKAELDRVLSDTELITRQARLVPHYTDGQMQGMRLYGLREDSALKAFGFANKDLILSVGGLRLTNTAAAMEIFAHVNKPETRALEVVYLRDEQLRCLKLTLSSP